MDIPSKTFGRPYKQYRHATCINFDSFVFVDNITNNKIILKDARKEYETNHQNRMEVTQMHYDNLKELDKLNQCVSTLKTTKLFQMDSLRNKIFKSAHNNKIAEGEVLNDNEILQKKHKLRSIIEMSITQMSLKQLRQCVKSSQYQVNPNIIELQKITGRNLTKKSVLKVIHRINSSKTQKDKQFQSFGKKITKGPEIPEVEIKDEKEILEKAEDYLKNTIKSNSGYLIKPKYEHELYQKLRQICKFKNQRHNEQKSRLSGSSDEKQNTFRAVYYGQNLINIKNNLQNSKGRRKIVSEQEKEILFAAQNNLSYDVEMLIIYKKKLMEVKDAKGNNLLHIAAKNRNLQLFTFLLKKMGVEYLKSKNNLKKTPLDIAKIYGVNSIIEISQNFIHDNAYYN